MNILQINTIDNMGGAAKVAYRLHQKYQANCHKSNMIVRYKLSTDPLVKTTLSTRFEKVFQLGWNVIASELNIQSHYFFTSRILETQEYKNADIINLHNLHGGYFNLPALHKITKKPTVWTFHDMWPLTGHCAHSFDCDKWISGCKECSHLEIYEALKKDISNKLWDRKKKICSESDFSIVVPSKWLMNKVKKSMLEDKKIELIYNGIDEKVFSPVDKEIARNILNLPSDKKIILFSAHKGIKNPWKGEFYLYEALKKLNMKDTLFLNIGGNVHDSLNLDAHRYQNIQYVYDEKLYSLYYSASDIFLSPAIAENCPLTVLEAMACGTPVIAFNTGGVPELVDHMKNGYVAEYKNSDDLKNGVELFLSDDNLREKAGILARKKIEDNFTLNQQVEDYLKLYAQILDRFEQARR